MILVVGSGGHALNQWRACINIHGDFKVVGVVDTDIQVLEQVEKLWQIEPDAIARSINETHHGIAIEAMRNHMHVICEKNMAHSMQAGLEMTRCALEHPELATVIGHQYPYWRIENWAMRKAIGTGQIGQLSSIQCDFNTSGYWNPGEPTRNGWRRFLDHDFLEDWAVHTLDLFRYFTAKDAIILSADLWRPIWSKRYGTSSINIRMLMADPSEYEGNVPLSWCEKTDEAKRLWKNGKIPSSWVHAQYVGHADEMGMFEIGEHWMIQGDKGSIEFMDGGFNKKKNEIRMLTHNYEHTPWNSLPNKLDGPLKWNISNLKPYPTDLECGPAKQWQCDNTANEFDSNVFILEEIKQCIESKGKIKPIRCFENTIKTFTIVMAAIESSKQGGVPIFLPDMWEIPRKES